jgi:hypothetical protein
MNAIVQRRPALRDPERRFYTGMAVVLFLSVYCGFAQSFFLRPWFPETRSPHEPFFYFHGAVFAAWFLLLIAQPSLVAAGRTDRHVRLGQIGAGLAVLMVIMGVMGALIAAHRPTGFFGVPIPPLQFLIVPLTDMLIFAALVGMAFVRRRDTQAHKRLMLLASIAIIDAAIARWPVGLQPYGPPAFFGIQDLFILALVLWDVASRRRLHAVTLWGGLLIIVSQPLRLALSGTEGWLSFARWATGLLA